MASAFAYQRLWASAAAAELPGLKRLDQLGCDRKMFPQQPGKHACN